MAAKGTAVFAEAVRLVADSLGVELDEIVCEAEYAQTTEDLEMASWTIPAGHVAGCFASWQGRVDGKTVIDLNVRWRKGQTLEPDWKLDGDGWKITIEGRPTVNMQVGFLPPPDMIENAKTIEDFFVLGHIMTAMPPIHAIPGRRRRSAGDSDLQRPSATPGARHGADEQLDAGTALYVAERALDTDAGVDRVPAPRAAVVPPPVVVMSMTVSTAGTLLCDVLRSGERRGGGRGVRDACAHADGAKRHTGAEDESCSECFHINHAKYLLSNFSYGARRRIPFGAPRRPKRLQTHIFRRPRNTITPGWTARESSASLTRAMVCAELAPAC